METEISGAGNHLPKGQVWRAPQKNGEGAMNEMPKGQKIFAPSPVTQAGGATVSKLVPKGPKAVAVSRSLPSQVDVIQALWEKVRSDSALVSANTFLTNQIKAKCRTAVRGWRCAGKKKAICGYSLCRADTAEAKKLYDALFDDGKHSRSALVGMECTPQMLALEPIESERNLLEKQIEELAKQLPVAEWCRGVRGFGFLSLGRIIGETGDLSKYLSHSKVWKRLGLAVIDGKGQRRCKDKKEAAAHAYNPRRRSMIWVVWDTMSKNQSARIDKKTGEMKWCAGRYRVAYDGYKARILEREGMTKGHAHRMAGRYATKIFVRDLWREWTRWSPEVGGNASDCVPKGPILDASSLTDA